MIDLLILKIGSRMFLKRTITTGNLFLLLNICLFLLINHVWCGVKSSSSSQEDSINSNKINNNNDDEFAEFEELDDDDDANNDEYVRPISSTPMSVEKPSDKSSNQVPEQSKSFSTQDSDPDSMIIEEDDEDEFETVREEIDDEKP